MSHVSAEYDGSYLTPDQIDLLHEGLKADLSDWADADAEAEAEPELEP
jgi:hypothetical protein